MEKKKQLFTRANKEKIASTLNARGALRKCPMCDQRELTIVDGYFNNSLQSSLQGFVIGGPSIPTAIVACLNCGFLSQHSLGVLGLLPKETPDSSNQGESAGGKNG